MNQNSICQRRENYLQLSSRLARLNNTQLRNLLNDHESSLGYGLNHTIFLEPFQIFVKRIPVTNTEYENLFSTKNLYNLPTYFNYGIGSVGINIFRELITHLKTTHWVLEEDIATFPLLYHYRIMPYSRPPTDVDREWLTNFVEYWGSSESVKNYMLDKANAKHELILFLEYMPHVLSTWLQTNLDNFQKPIDELCRTMASLRNKGGIHLDAHFQNILTDGEQIYLSDFGLVLDRSFDLSKEEEAFYDQNLDYDYAEILLNLAHMVVLLYDSCSKNDQRKIKQTYGIQEGLKPHELRSALLNNIEHIQADGMMLLDRSYVASIVKYRDIISLIHTFFADMRMNSRKDTSFPQAKLRSLLEEAGFASRYEIPEPKSW